ESTSIATPGDAANTGGNWMTGVSGPSGCVRSTTLMDPAASAAASSIRIALAIETGIIDKRHKTQDTRRKTQGRERRLCLVSRGVRLDECGLGFGVDEIEAGAVARHRAFHLERRPDDRGPAAHRVDGIAERHVDRLARFERAGRHDLRADYRQIDER